MVSNQYRYSSLFQVKVVKLAYILNSFLFFAIFSRTLLLINLIGLFQHISNGVHDFYSKSVIFITISELLLTISGLTPTRVHKILFRRSTDLYMVYLFQNFYDELTKNQIYSVYLIVFSLFDLFEYINHYYGMFKIGKFKSLQVTNSLILGSIKAVLEFLIIFKSLTFIQKGVWLHFLNCVILLGFIPVKYTVIKKAVTRSSASKMKRQ